MSGFKLYEIDHMLAEAIAAAAEKIDPETGELPEDWYNFLDAVQYDRDRKCLDVARYIKSLDAEAEAIKADVRLKSALRYWR